MSQTASCDCGKGRGNDIAEIHTGGHNDAIPGPKTSAPGMIMTGGGERATAGQKWIGLAALTVVAIIIIAAVAARKKKSEGFFTRYAEEEPTRSYTPYTGTIPYGPWGTKSWADAYDMELPQDAYFYLPPPYRPFMDVL